MTVQPNSLAAYDTVDLSSRQAEVFGAIRDLHRLGRKPSDQDVAVWLDLPINSVTGRRGELHEQGLIVLAEHKKGPTGRKVAVWAPSPVQLSFWESLHSGAVR